MGGAEFVAVSPEGSHIYVAGRESNSLAVFQWQQEGRHLTFLGCVRNGDDHGGRRVSGLGGVYSVLISSDGRYVYTTSFDDGAVSVFRRDADSGELTFVQSLSGARSRVSGLSGAEFATISPDGRYLYTAATEDNAVAVFRRQQSDGVR
jgi:6-phosphogluconolactonase (cycloisomerase 2 family)